ncbi:GH25 family lysozyme [Heyndrickxia acidicola]|uniref:Lysozyme n=1 Tax=Heyndrickxia acidicola TaxID=209389 RepID=A0ABU6MKU7_9BACI|nr:GH25 family lysozyme [Heyndrickxia acidicola]MED1205317.1 GH25 family lysozyme [Heyndrickxia acidicola]
MKKKKRRSGLLVLLLGAAVVAYLLWSNGIFVPNDINAKPYSVKGVDVSSYQGKVDWSQFEKQGVRFAFIKATEGSSFVDKYFKTNWQNAEKTNIRVGAYHFFSYDSAGKTQAENYIRTVPANQKGLPPVIDLEFYGNKEKNPPNPDKVIKELQTMVKMLNQHYHKRVIIYATQKSYNMYLKGNLAHCDVWISNVYTKPLLLDNRGWAFWQYTNRGRLTGHSGKKNSLDLNVFRGTEKEFNQYGL